MKMEKMNKREWLKEKQLMIWARTGYWVTQSSLDEVFISDDSIILQQIEALKKLREQYPKLQKEVNSDLFELMTNPNTTRIKQYNEQYAVGMRNTTEEEMIEILYWLSVFEGSGLTLKQKDLLIDVCSGFSYEGNAKNFLFMIKKLEKARERVNKMSDKRNFNEEQLAKLFPNFYSKPNTLYDEYLNLSKKLSCYNEDVEQSKIRMNKIRALSLATAIIPLNLECNEVKE